MELFHNQVTLDFPSAKPFKKELGKEYDYIGISFIVPNFKKAQEMARTVRESSPKAKIILGGHGVSIPNIESMIDHDFIRKGEGVSFCKVTR